MSLTSREGGKITFLGPGRQMFARCIIKIIIYFSNAFLLCVCHILISDRSINTNAAGRGSLLPTFYNIDSKENEVSRIFFHDLFISRKKKSHQNERIKELFQCKRFFCVKTKGEKKFNEFSSFVWSDNGNNNLNGYYKLSKSSDPRSFDFKNQGST